MTEFVVYEDSPLAEYLESIDQAETTVKVPLPPSLIINNTNSPSNNISSKWRRSVFRDAFSISLPKAEETAFEEKFKYLIVTSPLLNERLSVHHHNNNRIHNELPFQPPIKRTALFPNVTAHLVATLGVLVGIERVCVPTRPVPAISLFLSASASLFFLYRHNRRSQIHQLYQLALSRIKLFTDHSDTLDLKIHRVLITIQEIELVSRGYRLSTPLSPISRIEQQQQQQQHDNSSHKATSRKCIQLRNKLAFILRRAFIAYEEAIIDLISVTNKANLSTLYDMYNVHSIASLSAMGHIAETTEAYSLEELKKLAQLMHLKRRECMVHFLALGVMTEDHDSVRLDYREGWKTVNDVLEKLGKETECFANETVQALEQEFHGPMHTAPGSTSTKIGDARLRQFVHRLSLLEQQLRTMEAKLYLCNEDVRQLNSEEPSSPSSLSDKVKQKLCNEYLSLEKGFQEASSEWENGKVALEAFLSPPLADRSIQVVPTVDIEDKQDENDSKTQDSSEGKGLVLDSEDVADILNLPLASKASVYEAIAGVVEKNGKEKSKKSRQERIEEMKVKRTQVAEEKSIKLDSQSMVHELKSVLHKRTTDLDLQDEDASNTPAI